MIALGHPRFRARQLFAWMHGKGVLDAGRMGNLPADLRRRIEPALPGAPVSLLERVASADGTEKYRFGLRDGGRIESVWIPEQRRSTLCVSTQLGCAMGCAFCRTGRMGLKRNLQTAEIVGQYYAVRDLWKGKRTLTHVVLMGMGEPLANLRNTVRALRILAHPLGCGLSPRRLTVSTVGIPEALTTLFERIPVSITLSLNAADDATRSRLMPVNRTYPMGTVLETLRGLPLPPRRRFSIAYVMLRGVNDRPEDARRLVRLLHGLRCKVNLIPFNAFPGSRLRRPDEDRVAAFRDLLRSKGVSAHIRQSRGDDALAACGQLGGEGEPTEGSE